MILSYEPALITQGDTVKWKKTFADYPADDGWQLQYILGGASDQVLSFGTEIIADGKGFLITIADSSSFSVGDYWWQAKISKSGEIYTVAEGILKVISTASTYKQLLHITTVLDAIEAVIQNRASKDQESYSINGRSLSRTSIPDLIILRNEYLRQRSKLEKAENIRKGLGSGQIQVRFNR